MSNPDPDLNVHQLFAAGTATCDGVDWHDAAGGVAPMRPRPHARRHNRRGALLLWLVNSALWLATGAAIGVALVKGGVV